MNSVHSDLFYGMYENIVLMNMLQQITSPYLSSHKSYYIFKLGPLLLMTLYKTKHITCCINCKGIQHHISEHVYKVYIIIVTTYNFPKSHINIFQKLHVLFILQLNSLSSTFSPNYFLTCLKRCSKIPPISSSEHLLWPKNYAFLHDLNLQNHVCTVCYIYVHFHYLR